MCIISSSNKTTDHFNDIAHGKCILQAKKSIPSMWAISQPKVKEIGDLWHLSFIETCKACRQDSCFLSQFILSLEWTWKSNSVYKFLLVSGKGTIAENFQKDFRREISSDLVHILRFNSECRCRQVVSYPLIGLWTHDASLVRLAS